MGAILDAPAATGPRLAYARWLDRLLGIKPGTELNGHAVPVWLNTYDSLVLATGKLAEVELSAIPALLQTKTYAAAVERAGGPLSDAEVIERVDVRAERQKVLDRKPNPIELTVLLGLGVLLDPVGGPAVMAEQCDHLIEMAQRPNVDLRIIGPGRSPSALGGFELLTRPGDIDPFMAVTFSVDGPTYIDVGHRISHSADRLNHLVGTALPPRHAPTHPTHQREPHQGELSMTHPTQWRKSSYSANGTACAQRDQQGHKTWAWRGLRFSAPRTRSTTEGGKGRSLCRHPQTPCQLCPL